MIRRPPRSTLSSSSAASDVYKRQAHLLADARQLGRQPADLGMLPAQRGHRVDVLEHPLQLRVEGALGGLYVRDEDIRQECMHLVEARAKLCRGRGPDHVSRL